jgi:hypothetical protein
LVALLVVLVAAMESCWSGEVLTTLMSRSLKEVSHEGEVRIQGRRYSETVDSETLFTKGHLC